MKPKKLLQRVLDFAFSELERRSRSPDDLSPEPGEEEAKAVAAAPRETSQAGPSPAEQPYERAQSAPPERPAPPDSAHHVHGLEAVRSHQGEGLTLRWSLSPADVARARTLLAGKSVLCLRVVRFSTARDDVLREVQDRPGVELQGECELAEAPERAVVSLGLRAGERFVSISHHVL